MATIKTCDICKQQIPIHDEKAQDMIDSEYPGKDICPSCYLDLELAAATSKSALMHGISNKEAAQRWLAVYEGGG